MRVLYQPKESKNTAVRPSTFDHRPTDAGKDRRPAAKMVSSIALRIQLQNFVFARRACFNKEERTSTSHSKKKVSDSDRSNLRLI